MKEKMRAQSNPKDKQPSSFAAQLWLEFVEITLALRS
jgi:hypothetical protein